MGLIITIVMMVSLVPTARAVDHGATPGTSIPIDNPIKCNDVKCVVDEIVSALNILAIPVLTLMLLVGGFLFMFAGGDPKRVELGKKTLLYAVIGYAIIFLANGVRFIIEDVISV